MVYFKIKRIKNENGEENTFLEDIVHVKSSYTKDKIED